MPTVKPSSQKPAEGRRARSARLTRQRILSAASDLYIRQGYAATTIQQIAEQADVAWQTVYSIFGNKAAILSAVFDVTVAGDDEPVPMMQRPFVREIHEAADPRVKAAIFARHIRETNERTAGIVTVIESAAGTDPEIAGLWRKLQSQRLYGMGVAVENFQMAGVLRRDITLDRAADVLWFYTGAWAYHALVVGRGWTLDEYETWTAEVLGHELFDY